MFLDKAKSLVLPTREETLERSESVMKFWQSNEKLFVEAWKEWDKQGSLQLLSDSLLDRNLVKAVDEAWLDPQKEKSVEELMEKVCPGVFQFQLFDPEKLHELRDYLEKVGKAQIPLRAPYGIVLNRKGAMLDQRSPGYLAAPSFQHFYQNLIDIYMRPIARLLFPEVTGFDTQPFGFSIKYEKGVDTSLRMHTDASSVTLNVNLNLAHENFTGSEVDFIDSETRAIKRVTFKPGVALIHRGNVAHEAQHIKSGERTNFVLWLFGKQMSVPRFNGAKGEFSAIDRWSIPEKNYDKYAPF